MRGSLVVLVLSGLVACTAEDRPRLAQSEPGIVLPGGSLDRRGYLGRILYERHCTICHGDAGAGDGFNSFNLDPKPRDLRGLVDELGPDHVRKVILDGSAAVGKSPLCPPRRHTLEREEPGLVLGFLRTLERPAPE